MLASLAIANGVDEQAGAAPAARSPGRPREPEVDRRILAATFRLMAQNGYVRMSMDMVAAEAGVTKPTIYRRWSSKIEMALAALAANGDVRRPARVGDTRADLIAEIDLFRHALAQPHSMALMGAMLAEEYQTPELWTAFRKYLLTPRHQAFCEILNGARARGELCAEADTELAALMLAGACSTRQLIGATISQDWIQRLVDMVLAGVLRRP